MTLFSVEKYCYTILGRGSLVTTVQGTGVGVGRSAVTSDSR